MLSPARQSNVRPTHDDGSDGDAKETAQSSQAIGEHRCTAGVTLVCRTIADGPSETA
jgi:hypothetical protein